MVTIIGILIIVVAYGIFFHMDNKAINSVRISDSWVLIQSIIHNSWEDECNNDYIVDSWIWRNASCVELTKRLREGTYTPQDEHQQHETADALVGIAQYYPAAKFLATTAWGMKQLTRLQYCTSPDCYRPGAKKLISRIFRKKFDPIDSPPPD